MLDDRPSCLTNEAGPIYLSYSSSVSAPVGNCEQNKRKRANSPPIPPRDETNNVDATQNLLIEFLQHGQLEPNKKPGRKPLANDVSEQADEDPKIKRKVQNRAAQRAFRERKERYVRDLEMKMRRMQESHAHTVSQLTQEIQYLRAVVDRLKSELCTVKGIPVDSWLVLSPQPSPAWQPPQHHSTSPSLAPFLTLGAPLQQSTSSFSSSSSSLSPALSSSSNHHHNHQRRPVPIAPAPAKKPVRILPQPIPQQQQQQRQSQTQQVQPQRPQQMQHQTRSPPQQHQQQQHRQVVDEQRSKVASPPKSPTAMYVQFSPSSTHDTMSDDLGEYLSESAFASGSANEGSSKDLETAAPEKETEPPESPNTRMQYVWRRMNLYGRFTDFSFDQICRVAQLADSQDGATSRLAANPDMEDWELDKLMHQMDPDHL